jgi:hypothetical protein
LPTYNSDLGCRYGRWGYTFGRSPFNVQADEWHAAVDAAKAVRIQDLINFCMVSANGQPKPRKGWKVVLAVLKRYHEAHLLDRGAQARTAAGPQEERAAGEDLQALDARMKPGSRCLSLGDQAVRSRKRSERQS